MNKYIDHTLLKAVASESDIRKLCDEAIAYNFKAVCINPNYVSFAKEYLADSDVLVCTVIGFPLGASTTKVKVFEAKDAVLNGADEIDMVINIGRFKNKEYDYILNEINDIKAAIADKVLKVIVETAYLSESEIIKVSEIVNESNADFIKTSTGFADRGATIEDVVIMKSIVKDNTLIKAAGGVRSNADLIKMIEAGANRIGTSSGTKLIDKNEVSSSDY